MVCLGVLALLGSPVVGHEQKAALTDVLYNERTGNLEIAHRISLHDAEHSLYRATGLNADLIETNDAAAAFARYAAKQFVLISGAGETLPLTLVGQEIEGAYLWVYQETPIPDPVATPFYVENRILQDVITGQINTVNLRYRTRIVTHLFEAGSGRQYFRGWSIERKEP